MSQQGGFNKGVVNKQGPAKVQTGAQRTGMPQRDGENGAGTPPRPGQQAAKPGFKPASASKVPGAGANKGVVMGTRKPAPPAAKGSVPMAPGRPAAAAPRTGNMAKADKVLGRNQPSGPAPGVRAANLKKNLNSALPGLNMK